jgi:hypothetical protein
MRQSAMASMSERGMMMAIADVKCTATPVKRWAQHCGPTCAPSAGSTSSTCICTWRRMRLWSIQNASRLIQSAGCVWLRCQCTLVTHEPIVQIRGVGQRTHQSGMWDAGPTFAGPKTVLPNPEEAACGRGSSLEGGAGPPRHRSPLQSISSALPNRSHLTLKESLSEAMPLASLK